MKNEKAKHTPGPWEVHKSRLNEGSKYTILHPLINGPDAEPKYVGKLGGYHIVIGPRNCQPGYILDEKDAALIAAAPELLAALESLYRISLLPGTPADHGHYEHVPACPMCQARAAIAKVKGE